jgi:methylase of polypeptide subunit release factors
MELKTKSIETAIKGTVMARGSLSELGTRTWYADNLDNALHQTLKHYEDAVEYCKKHKDKKVYGVYLRFVKGQIVKVKIGKGVVYWIEHEGKARLTRDHNSADEQPLETKDGGAFIPCVDEAAALALEDSVHKFFGKLEGVHNSIDNKVSVVDTRWLKPGVNSEGGKGGTENFNFENVWKTKVDVFVKAVESVTQQSQINKRNFVKLARDSQVSGSDLLCEWLLNGGDMKDFFLLMKPRAGKNTTMFWGISKYIEILKKNNSDKIIIIDFLSLWPSAFSGAVKDIKDYYYINGITLAGVNTSDEHWQNKLEELQKDPTVDAVFRFASLQSIDSTIAKEYNDDEEREGAEIDYVPSKSEYFKSNPADLCVIDESDHGMRTTRSTDVLETFGYSKRVWMSGTDLYALKNKIVFNPIKNHFVYDILDEVQDVIAGKIKMPMMKKHSLIAKLLPFDDLDKDTMNEKEITRKIVALFETVTKGKWRYDKISDRFVDIDGNQFWFKNLTEVKLLWEKIYYWKDDIAGAGSDTPNPSDLRHLFCCMPSVASCMALYNHIKQGDIECGHEVLLANKFSSAERIEQQVNDAMTDKRTIFFTVGKMLRGAKAPWNSVLRFDKYSDYKVGLQLELRGQNTNEDWFHVYDANVFRAQNMKYEIVKSRSTGTKVYSDGKKMHNLIPMTRKGEFEEETVSWDDCVTSWQAGRITDSFKRDTLFNEQGLLNAKDLLEGSTKASDNVKDSKDDREGKEGGKNTGSKGAKSPSEKDDLKTLKAQAKTLSTMLPVLLIISDYKYREIDALIKNTSNDDLTSLLKDKCNIKNIGKNFKSKIIKMFDAEEINHQLYIASKKLENDQEINWSEFSNQSAGDVITPKDCVEHIIQDLPIKSFKSVLDPACGFGEMIIGLVNKGYKGKIFICDKSMLNIKITLKRLKLLNIDNFEYFLYNSISQYEEKIKEKDMKFDIILTNPPYNSDDTTDRGKDLNSNVRGQGDNLAKKFTYLNLNLLNEHGHMVSIMPYGNRTYSDSMAEHYKKNGLYKIDNVSDYFPNVKTSPCAFYFDKEKYIDEIEDNFKIHNLTVPLNNIGKIFKNQPGHLNRQQYENELKDSGKFKIVVTTSIQKYTDDETIVYKMKDQTRGNWRVVFNCTTSIGKWGKIIVEGPQSILSKSVHCLICNSEKQANDLKEYLESTKVKDLLSIVKLNSCNSKKFLKYIPMLEEKNG